MEQHNKGEKLQVVKSFQSQIMGSVQTSSNIYKNCQNRRNNFTLAASATILLNKILNLNNLTSLANELDKLCTQYLG